MKRLALCTCLAFGLAAPATADFDAGLEAYNAGDFETAFAEWEPLAEQGHPRAQYRLGTLYIAGEGVQRSLRKAFTLYEKAAIQGVGRAQNDLAYMYLVGNGVKPNDRLAAEWYLEAARRGVPDSQLNIGLMYVTARGVEKNTVQAYRWLSLAAAWNLNEARQALLAVADEMTAAEIAEGQRLAGEWRFTPAC